jgi:Zyg-11 family protein
MKFWWQVTGIATESQLLEALRRYTHRPVYVQKCLYNLFRLTPNFGDARVDVIQVCVWKDLEYPRAYITIICEPLTIK